MENPISQTLPTLNVHHNKIPMHYVCRYSQRVTSLRDDPVNLKVPSAAPSATAYPQVEGERARRRIDKNRGPLDDGGRIQVISPAAGASDLNAQVYRPAFPSFLHSLLETSPLEGARARDSESRCARKKVPRGGDDKEAEEDEAALSAARGEDRACQLLYQGVTDVSASCSPIVVPARPLGAIIPTSPRGRL